MAGEEFSFPLRVYIEDTDAGGIVYYVNYLKFMERARTELMRSLGFGKDYIFTHELMFVVRDMTVKYLKPARLDEQLQVTALVTQSVERKGELLAQGEVTIACVERSSMKPRRIPAQMMDRLVPPKTNKN